MSSLKIANQLCKTFEESKLNTAGHVSFVITKHYIFEVFDSNVGTHVYMSKVEKNAGFLIKKMCVKQCDIENVMPSIIRVLQAESNL